MKVKSDSAICFEFGLLLGQQELCYCVPTRPGAECGKERSHSNGSLYTLHPTLDAHRAVPSCPLDLCLAATVGRTGASLLALLAIALFP